VSDNADGRVRASVILSPNAPFLARAFGAWRRGHTATRTHYVQRFVSPTFMSCALERPVDSLFSFAPSNFFST